MEDNKKISQAVIKRLPRYYRYLGYLLSNDIVKTSSKELSRLMDITASQVRQDLNNFGCFGQQGYGYDVNSLYEEMKKILGIDDEHNMVIIGCGNLGQALANYNSFGRVGFKVTGMFDKSPSLIGKDINGIVIQDIDQMNDFLQDHKVDVAVLTIPRENAEDVAKILSRQNIKGIWNFSNVELKLENSKIMVENTQITDSLMTLAYRMQGLTV